MTLAEPEYEAMTVEERMAWHWDQAEAVIVAGVYRAELVHPRARWTIVRASEHKADRFASVARRIQWAAQQRGLTV